MVFNMENLSIQYWNNGSMEKNGDLFWYLTSKAIYLCGGFDHFDPHMTSGIPP